MTDEITSLPETATPDPDQIALVIADAFSQAYGALNAAWELIGEQKPDEAQSALVAVNTALNVMTEQIAMQSAVIAGLVEANSELQTERDDAVADFYTLQGEVDEQVEEAYERGHDELLEDPYILDDIAGEAIEEYKYEIVDNASYAADKLREVGEAAMADEVEETAKRAVDLREQAEKLVARAHDVAYSKRPKMLKPGEPLPFDDEEDDEEGGSVDD